MDVILLCAGFGTRMYPVTEDCSKSLLPVAGKPVLDYLMEQFIDFPSLETIYVVTNHRFYPQFLIWCEGWKTRLNTKKIAIELFDNGVRNNEERLGAVKDLQFVLHKSGNIQNALVAAGDNILRFSLQPIWQKFQKTGSNIVIALKETDPEKLRKSGVLKIGANDRVLALHEKPQQPTTNWICPPFYFLNAKGLNIVDEYLSQSNYQDAPGHFIAYLVEHQPIYAFRAKKTRFDIGSIEDYKRADQTLKKEPAIF